MITIRYSCKACGIKDRKIQVPNRTTESLKEWEANVLTKGVVEDHSSVSPHCKTKAITEVVVLIPAKGKTNEPKGN